MSARPRYSAPSCTTTSSAMWRAADARSGSSSGDGPRQDTTTTCGFGTNVTPPPSIVRAKNVSVRLSISSGVSGPGGYVVRAYRCRSPERAIPSANITSAGTLVVIPQSLMRSVRAGGRKLRTAMHGGKWASATKLHAGLLLGQADRIQVIGGFTQGRPRLAQHGAGELEHRSGHA